MYIILLNKRIFNQISSSERSGTPWQYGCPGGMRLWKGWEPCFRWFDRLSSVSASKVMAKKDHNFWTRNVRKSIKGSKDSDSSL